MAPKSVEIEICARVVTVSNPDKVFFSARQETKLDLVNYYVALGDCAVNGVRDRPTVLKRYPDGAEGEFFFQKRVPERRPSWLRTAKVRFPSGRYADELCPTDLAHVVWAVNLGAIGLDPWPVRQGDLDHPDELRVDLDPQPGVPFATVRSVALAVDEVLTEIGITGWPKTSGSRGIHVYVPIEPSVGFDELRSAALALGREVERRMPDMVTTAWWKRDRGEKVFVDYNQNARDRTVASAYSVRATPDARVSFPLRWPEVADVEPDRFNIATVPELVSRQGDAWAGMEDRRFDLSALLEMAQRDRAQGIPDAPMPPRFSKPPFPRP